MSNLESMKKNELIEMIKTLQVLTNHAAIGTNCKAGPINIDSNMGPVTIGLELFSEGIWVIDKDAKTVFVNVPMARILGYTLDEMTGRSLFDFMDSNGKTLCEQYIAKRKEGKREVHDFTFQHKSGWEVKTRIATSPLMDADGNYAGAVAGIVDISDLHALREQLLTNFNNTPLGMAHLSLTGDVLFTNPAIETLTGYSGTELRSMNILSIVHPDDRQACETYIHESVQGVTLPKISKRYLRKSGETIWVALSLLIVNNPRLKSSYFIATMEDVTRQFEAEEALRNANWLLAETQILGKVGGWMYDVPSGKGTMTDALCQLLGYGPQEIVDVHDFFMKHIVHPDDQVRLDREFFNVISSKKAITTEFRILRKDGHERIMLGTIVPLLDSSGEIQRVYGTNQDITERKAAEEQILLNEKRFRSYFEIGLVGMGILSPDRHWHHFNDKLCEMLGYSREELSALDWITITHPDDVAEALRLFDELVAGKRENYTMDKRYIRKDGRAIHVTIQSSCSRNKDGTAEYVMTHVMDTTERAEAEREASWNLKMNMALARLYAPLVATNATMKNTAEEVLKETLYLTGSKHGYACTFGEHGAIIQAISNMVDDCAVSTDHESMVFSKDATGKFPSLWGYSLNTRQPFISNSPQDHPSSSGLPNGHVRLDCFMSVPVILGKELVGQLAVANKPGAYDAHDIDAIMRIASYYALAIQRVKNKQEISASKALLESILDGIQAGIMVIDPQTQIIESVNDVALKMLRVTRKEILGQSCGILCLHAIDGKSISRCPAQDFDIRDREIRIQRKDGTILPAAKTVLKNTVNGKLKYFEIFFDITERKEFERRLNLAQKLESIGQLSAGIAHEINTPTQYLGDNLNFLTNAFTDMIGICRQAQKGCLNQSDNENIDICNMWEDLDMDYLIKEIPTALAQSQDGISRISSIVQAMKRFSHPGMDSRVFSDINEALQNTTTVCRNEWKYTSSVIFELDPELPLVSCYINDLNQVFLNLIVNAAQAIASKKKEGEVQDTITIRTRREDPWVVIEIEDTGEGIEESVLPRIFDPFFTTKEVGSGTGQGLALCHSIIVKKHQGIIEFSSQPGIGTLCTIKLPINVSGKDDHAKN